MQDHRIADSQISASSSVSGSRANKARLEGTYAGWQAGRRDLYQWLQIDLAQSVIVVAVATQGNRDVEMYVTSYFLMYKQNTTSTNWTKYQEHGVVKVSIYVRTSLSVPRTVLQLYERKHCINVD